MRVSRSNYLPEAGLMRTDAKVGAGNLADDRESHSDTAETFGRVLRVVGKTLDEQEANNRSVIASIASGHDMSSAQLIALQTDVYRYSEVIDMSSRFIDRVTGGVKTVIQGSGQ
jgi:hypothetical protein